MEGKTVQWMSLNGMVQGIVVCKAGHGEGNWVVDIGGGKVVTVNEKSFRE